MREANSHCTVKLPVALALAFGLACWAWAADPGRDPPPADVEGLARVVDGDTISVAGIHIRLEGIDAPEVGQPCRRRQGESWPCGSEASATLARLLADRAVRCERRGLDKYGRTLGVCFLGAQDVNAWMVRHGQAWAFTKYSTSYVRQEEEARAERLGIWQGTAMPAWDYRSQRWARAERQAPLGCVIKGNVTAHGKIYHMPWSPWYSRIRMDPDRGRRWFCTEAEALAAGWRPVNLN